jgi:hypothetical protein
MGDEGNEMPIKILILTFSLSPQMKSPDPSNDFEWQPSYSDYILDAG